MIKVKELISKQWLYAHLEIIFVVITMLLLILATFKYVSHGEAYIYEVQGPDDKVELNNNIVSQDIVIDENAEWSKYSYAVYIYSDEKIEEGVIDVVLSQWGGVVDRTEIRPVYIKTGWCELRGLDYSKLEPGYATIQLSGQNLDKPVYVGIKNDVYNIPNCSINGEITENTLEQRYHYNFNNFEYKLRCAAYILFILISIAGTYIVCTKEDSVKTSYLIYAALTISYLCLTFIYDSSVWMSPTWAEAVTNFLYYGQNETIWNNIMQTDVGYWPLFQRLLALIVIRGLRLPAYYALFVMQAVAYFISGLILSFFAKYQFREYFSLKYRYLLSLLFIIMATKKDTGVFISFITYEFLIIMFYFMADSKEWTRREFITICVISCLACMSKGNYVTILPFMIVCVILFYKNYSKRDIIFSISCAIGALFQMIYYFANGSNWIDRNGESNLDYYYINIVLQSVVDAPERILILFNEVIDFLNGISLFIIVGYWLLISYIFVKEVFIKYKEHKKIEKNTQLILMSIIYIFAQLLFLRITAYGITVENIFSDVFWKFSSIQIDRYQIPIFVAVFLFYIVAIKLMQEKSFQINSKIQMISIAVIMLCAMVGQSRLQLKGIENDNYVATRTKFADMTADFSLFRDLENVSCRAVPIQPNTWVYDINASLYCLGDNIYSWRLIQSTDESADEKPVNHNDFEMEETWTGSVTLGDYPINTDCEIWQVFITKLNLIERSNYKIVLLDSAGNIIHQQTQDNTNYQKLTSFTFDRGISNVNQIVILDGNDNRVYIENSMYIVTEEDQQYFME